MSEKISLNLPLKLKSLINPFLDATLEYYLRNQLRPKNYVYRIMFGPPFTSGTPHLGTLYSQLVKEILTSLKFISGYRTILKPGFDCHGLPTENLAKNSPSINSSFFHNCLLISRKNMIQQVAYFKHFGIIASWDEPYCTASLKYSSSVSYALKKLALKGYLSLGFREVDYCVASQSIAPLSEIEKAVIENLEIELGFRCCEDPELFFWVWTTTPWSLEGNVCLAYNPSKIYGIYLWKGYRVIKILKEQENFTFLEILKDPLSSLSYRDLQGKIRGLFPSDWVEDQGSGLVHISSLYDRKDFALAEKMNLERISLHQNFRSVQEQSSCTIKEICKLNLPNRTFPVSRERNIHVRTGTQTIKLMSKQFMIDTSSSRAKALFLEALKNVEMDQWRGYMMQLILRNKDDWCLSRNRTFNSPLVFNPFTKETRENMIPRGWIGNDVWFDSANSPFYCFNGEAVDLMLEGVDQYKGFFLRSLQLGSLLYRKAPMKKILSTGFIVDKEGRKFSKSKGQQISLLELKRTYGSDTVRLWSALAILYKDVIFSKVSLDRVNAKVKKWKNFLLYLSGYAVQADFYPIDLLGKSEKWILHLLLLTQIDFLRDISKLRTSKTVNIINTFIEKVSSFYIHPSKSFVYTSQKDSPFFKGFCFVTKKLLKGILIMLSSFVPVLCREINNLVFKKETIWHFKMEWSGFHPDNFKLFSESLSTYQELRPVFEKALSSEIVSNPWKSTLVIPFRKNDDFLKALEWFSFWNIKVDLTVESSYFIPYTNRCLVCLRRSKMDASERCKICENLS